ncbi:ubiquitin carboxyl-terminal hydrolase 18 [Cornus florida]|uniref:ubiquitin carboxyl-terminal hydrolase 18 n=1 Tax=Cornus florida TaxID=4283 RepID=UPI0028998009|nr:ubiquitin carboxyl-terminal hydrolase 18 [Cornus florida]
MHVSGFSLDLNWFIQFIVTAFIFALGVLHLVKNTASKYFVVDANFESSYSDPDAARNLPGVIAMGDACVVCGNFTKKHCSGCKRVRYCSEACQSSHWRSGHNKKCKDLQLSGRVKTVQSASMQCGRKSSPAVALVPASGATKTLKLSKEILFPYEDFVELFNWDKAGFTPCGLLNCGNSCFANVVLQCLAYTRPLVAYLLGKGHRRECRRNDWCFLCELQTHIERASESRHPFSPINILSRLPNIGGNLGYGKQEDAHEFMRFAIDTMQLVCLDEFGGEKALHPSSQETTLIQHIFGGHLQSQVICTKCNNISNQYENMMDLTVEIQGDAASLEECLDQFTIRERLHGDNMYKCDGCNDYVMAWKRLTVWRAPNILTVALKRFQSGRFGKLNKRVTFPETLDLRPYMSEARDDGDDIYKLYAVVVHVDMLNASFFGHYICYTKDLCGNWFRIDDSKVTSVELDDVLVQGAYMLLYSRVCARPSCLKPIEPTRKEKQQIMEMVQDVGPCVEQPAECFITAESSNSISISTSLPSDGSPQPKLSRCEEELPSITNSENVIEDLDVTDSGSSSSITKGVELYGNGHLNTAEETVFLVERAHRLVSGVVSSLTEMYTPEAHFLNSESPAPISGTEVGDGAESTCTKEFTLMGSSSESSLSSQNGVCEKDEASHGVFVSGLSSNEEDKDEKNLVDFEGEPENVKSGKGLPSSSTREDAARKLSGRNSSGAKLQPLFPPGFLVERGQAKVLKKDGKAPLEAGELASACGHNSCSNGFAKPGFPHPNGVETKGLGKPFSECNCSSTSTSEEQAEKCLNEDELFLTESSGSFKLSNGDSNAIKVSDQSICNIKGNHPLVGEP